MKRWDLPKILLAAFVLIWAAFAIKPLYPYIWLLENILIFAALPVVIWTYYKFRLSNLSYVFIFLFGALHVAAAHYSYGDTPWWHWISGLFDWQRNHSDRIAHFLYGFLMAGVLLDIFKKYLPGEKFLRSLVIFSILVAAGSLYEVGEYIAAVILDPDRGLWFIGFQGDVWDTQKDIALQSIGAILGLASLRRFFKNA